MEVNIQTTAATIDRGNQQEVTKFNKLVKDYKELLFFDIPKKPRDENGKVIDLDSKMKTFQETFRNKTMRGEFGSKIKDEFKPMTLQELFKQKVEDKK